jgi:L-seryl-tRNA(Ser) seleniumtransferase
MLSMTAAEVRRRAEALAARLNEKSPALTLRIVEGSSAAGGGAAPTAEIPTALLRIEHRARGAQRLVEELRAGDPPVVARVADGALVVDLRTVLPEEENALLDALLRAVGASG